MSIYMGGVIVSIILYIIIGNYAGKRVKDVDDYYVSGRNAPTILIAGTLFASMLSTNGFMGDTAYAYTGHITLIVIINTLCAGGYILGPMFFGRYLRRSEVLTMPEYFGKRFNCKKVQRFAGITTVISLSAYLLAVIQGTGLLMQELTGLSSGICLLIAWFCFTSFTFYSGSKGVILTDTIMFIIFIAATVVAGPFIFEKAGGLGNIVTNLLASSDAPKDLLAYHGTLAEGVSAFDAMSYAITIGIVWLITVSVSPWQASRGLMAQNEHVTIRSGVVAAICTTIFLTFLYVIAISMNLINPAIQPTEKVIIWACFNVVPAIIGVFVLTGVMAAGLSSASTFLSVVGFSATNDIVEINFKDQNQQLWFSRWIMLAIGIVALILAYFNPPAIRVISWFASTVIAASWGPVAFMSVWNKKITAKGALWGMVMGFFGNVAARLINNFTPITLKNLYHPFFIGLFLGFLGIYIGTKTSKVTKEEEEFFKNMHITPESEKAPELFNRDRLYGKVLIVSGVVISAILLVYWAIPFNSFAIK
ncbi:sodium:solute symporter family protein [Anaeromicrobium sediminis]|uniref:Sodium:solute symporter n=1 Tax=Anaeromicrobium sediminis TaxID=1478221 RepID=A0A267MI81_9FIRM|nr:sodium:solute symporter family protein [Anaeromicrobium sediminis]PAB59122.1 sodium:solute symporter [Anaeromicrobium sediminis]